MTPKQFALLRIAKLQLGLDDETYRTVLRNHGGVESAKQLDNSGLDRVLNYFRAQGFVPMRRQQTFGERAGMASEKQVAMIRARWHAYSGDNDERALGRWLERTCKVTALRFLTAVQAQKAITGLQKMTIRKQSEAPAAESHSSTASPTAR